jgi:hypothetical protein
VTFEAAISATLSSELNASRNHTRLLLDVGEELSILLADTILIPLYIYLPQSPLAGDNCSEVGALPLLTN